MAATSAAAGLLVLTVVQGACRESAKTKQKRRSPFVCTYVPILQKLRAREPELSVVAGEAFPNRAAAHLSGRRIWRHCSLSHIGAREPNRCTIGAMIRIDSTINNIKEHPI